MAISVVDEDEAERILEEFANADIDTPPENLSS